MGAKDKRRSISTRIAIKGFKKHQSMDWGGKRSAQPGLRVAGHSMQILDALGLLLGQDARREALLLMKVDPKILPPLHSR